jgi:hypothetical protein
MARSLFVPMSRPVAGREQEYTRWYEDVHMAEVLEVPGIGSAQRFTLDAAQMPVDYTPACPFAQAGMFEVDGDPSTVAHELARRAEGGVFQMTADLEATQASFYEARTVARGEPHDDGDGALLIFTAPSPGHEASAYHEWYDDVHLTEVLQVPGIRSAQRWTLSGDAMPARLASPPPHPDLAVYKTSAPAAAVAAELERRFVGGVFDMSPALDMTTLHVWFFAPATSRREASEHVH